MTDHLPERVEVIEQKLDALSLSVDRRFAEVDRRFDEVDRRFDEVDRRFDEVTAAFVEQRQYTEFAFERLRAEMQAGFRQLTTRLERVEHKIDRVVDVVTTLAGHRARPPRGSKKR